MTPDDPLLSVLRETRAGTQSPSDDPLLSVLQERNQPKRPGKLASAATALVSGLPGMEAIGGAVSALTGGTYQGGRRDIARMQEEAKQTLGSGTYTALNMAPQVAAAFTPMGGTSFLGRTAFQGGVGAVTGASRAGMEREEAPSLGETAGIAARQGAYTAGGSMAAEGILGAGVRLGRAAGRVTGIDKPLGRVVNAGRRAVTDALESPRVTQALQGTPLASVARGAARIVEPMDETATARIARETLPASGETAEMAALRAREARSAIRPAAQAAREEGQDVMRLAREQRTAVNESTIGGARGLVRETRQQGRQTIQQAQREAEDIIAKTNNELAGAVPNPRAVDPNALRQTIRAEQLAKGDESYRQAFELAGVVPPSFVERTLNAEIARVPIIAKAYNNAVRGLEMPEGAVPDLRTLDRMRQEVSEFVQSRNPEISISRIQAREAWDSITRIEERYLDALPDKAASALKNARAEYRQYFERLEALADGRNLSRYGVGKREGTVQPSSLSLDALERRMADWSPESQEAFKVGAGQWVNDQIAKGSNVMALARQLVGTPERIRRARLALGDDATEQLAQALGGVRQAAARESGVSAARETAMTAVEEAREFAGQNVSRMRGLGREQASDAQNLARQIVRQRVGPLRQQAAELGQVAETLGLGRRAITTPEAGRTFATAVLPTLDPAMRGRTAGVMATAIVDELSQLPVAQAIARIRQLQSNTGANVMLSDALKQAERQLSQMVPLRNRAASLIGGNLSGALARPEVR
jgi:hypothetical protein